MIETKRVAVFQSHWALQAHTVLLVDQLARNGFAVDLFLNDCPQFYPVDDLRKYHNVRVVEYKTSHNPQTKQSKVSWLGAVSRSVKILLKEAYAFLGLDLSSDSNEILDPNASQMIEPYLDKTSYDWFIGVEKEGFLLAGEYALRQGKPYIYYSLELYTRDHPLVKTSPRWQAIHKMEVKYLQTAQAVVIQDEIRGAVFSKDYHLPPVDMIYVPISLDPAFYDLSPDPHSSENEFDLIQLGVISKERFTFQLVDVANRSLQHRKLLIHGHGEGQDVDRLKRAIHSGNIKSSLERVDAHQLPGVIRRAKVGLALYSPKTDNERLTIRSSEKIPLYLLCGKPVITFDHEGCEFLEQNRCGAQIHSLDDLPAALDRILSDYSEYSRNALRCFDQYYRYETNAQKLLDYLRSH